ncbi:outer membrane protein assembly factor BamB family protein [Bremerella sp. P1]|uniref:outer membrane protein assembly factor BamB family protein n=1 Tax=Bremerella sp. P1 TaxID=3026424 RepID=UPI002367EE9E|nr:PQQ-binding-like beta-propeller repeat protein [Bremerella sp. P1]WDI42335.1 PQQ-binding-like beta-propeller repeat protein [Bremerella sp. P1]
MKISDFIDLIEAHDYMADNQIAAIRRQMNSGQLDVTVEELVRFLLDRQRLTKYQAKKLLAEARSGVTAESIPVSEGRRRAQQKWMDAAPVSEEIVETEADDLVALDDMSSEQDATTADPLGLGGIDGFSSEPDEVDPFQESGDDKGKSSAHKKKTSRANPWDSPLLLFGGGGLVLLLLVGGLLYFWLAFDSGDDMFQAAEKSYRSGSYVQAGAEYNKFIRRFPDHPSAPVAEVRLGMATLWNMVEGGSDWELALKTTQEVLPEIDESPAFDEARPELATILPEIASGLTERAQQSESVDEKLRQSDLASAAMELVNDPTYLPTSLREAQQSRIETIEMNLVRVRREIDRDQAKNEALAKIEEKTAEGKFQEVYQLRRSLVDSYPGLRTDESLIDAVSGAAKKLVDQVIPLDNFPAPITEDDNGMSLLSEVTLVQREPVLPASTSSETAVFRLDGTAYAIEVDSGKLLWRRYVGMDDNAQAVSWTADGDKTVAALIDTRENQLLAVDQRTGEVLWKQKFESQLFRPKVFENSVLVAERSGKVWKIARESGEVIAAVQVPQEISAPLGMLDEVAGVYAVAEHSNVYVLSPDNLICGEVIPVGHEVGTITVEPTGTLRQMFLFENAGLEYSFLHLYSVDAGGGGAKLTQDVVRQAGQVLVTPIVADARLVATNDRGEVLVYEVNTAAKDVPVRLVAATKADSSEPILGYAAVSRGDLWVCDRRMTRYVMQLSRGSVVRKMVDHDGDTFVARPLVRGDKIIHARRSSGADGYVIEAQRIQANKLDDIWQTTIGTPTAGKAFTLKGADSPLVVTTRGAVYPLPKLGMGNTQIIEQPESKLDVTTKPYQFSSGQKLDDTNEVFFPPSGENRSMMVSTRGDEVIARVVPWEIPATDRVTLPVVWDDYVLIPTKIGQILVVDAKSGAADVQPYQPELAFGETIDWSNPAVVGGSTPSVIVSDRRSRLFRLAIETSPEPHLTALDQVKLTEELSGDLAVAGLMLVGVGSKAEKDVLRLFQLPEMAEQDPIEISGDVVMSPEAVDGRVYCATAGDGLIAIRDDFSVAWKCPLNAMTIASGPVSVNDMLAVSFTQGQVWLINEATGELVTEFNVGEPLADGLSYFDGQLWVHGYDGTLHGIALEGLTQ